MIWFGRKVLPYLSIEILFFAGFMFLIGRYVFVAKVLEYASQIFANNSINPAIWTSFALHIFLKTKLIVQLSVLGSLTMIILLFKNFIISILQFILAKDETRLASQVLYK